MSYRRFLPIFLACFALRTFSQIVINEIHFSPAVKTEAVEFVELYNAGNAPVALEGWHLDGAVKFTFPAGSTIAAAGYAVAAENPAALKAKYGATSLGPWTGRLSSQGETVVLYNAKGEVADSVSYGLGFPWPTVGDPPGYSIELINPAFDNDLGGNWRASIRGDAAIPSGVLIPQASLWKYRKGTEEPSTPTSAWQTRGFDDSGWSSGKAPVGYDPSVGMGTTLADMRGHYTSFYLRRTFQVDDPSTVGSLTAEALYDDGFQLWINGQRVINASMPDREVAYNELATGSARESANYDKFTINSPASLLRAGENIIAVQVHNISLDGSSDCFFDLKLTAEFGSSNSGPTPGLRNVVFDTNAPPVIRQVEHTPEQPHSGESVRITAKVTDPDGIGSVKLLYQVVEPGNYIELNDPSYETSWQEITMTDDGTGGDALANDGIYTVTIPSSVQVHRRLIRYRILASDSGGRSLRVPYPDDPEPNFAYFVYNGVPAWQAAIQPGGNNQTLAAVQTFSAAEMGRLPTYHLLSKRASVEDATWNSKYGGDLYRWWGTLVYDGKVYDHIRYRARGGVWRYAMGKNMWKFDLNRGHEFQARDNYGQKYKTRWKKLNLGACIQQGDYLHRGEQGMFESVGFALFNLAGIEAPKTHWINFRVIDDAAEAPPNNQYGGDHWGLYLAVEQEDGRFLDEHDLPDGNLYKMESGTGELNNQGAEGATDKSDLNSFLNTYRAGNPAAAWWRQNFEVDQYFSYHSIVQGIHHYDICDGKNYFYYLNPETRKWSIHTWDLDLTWANNMYRDCDGADPFYPLVTGNSAFLTDFKNRAREIRDLLYNPEETGKLIDEFSGIVRGTNAGPNVLAADRAMWDYNPIMKNSSIVNLSKAGQGLFYQFPYESSRNPARKGSFEAGIAIMKDYVVERSAFLDRKAADPLIPARPELSYIGPTNYPINQIKLRCSAYSGTAPFAAMKWRVAEVRDPAPGIPGIYEINSVWESSDLTAFSSEMTIPPESVKIGHTYRARVRMQDATGRWSNWSEPVAFGAGEPDNSTALQEFLRVSEIMYNPPLGSDWEYIEVLNTSANLTLRLDGVSFTAGVDFTFPTGSSLSPGEYALVVKADPANAFATFRQFYKLASTIKVFGPYNGSLNNDGERLTLKTAAGGTDIVSFAYSDSGGWPTAADGAGHSLVAKEEALARLNASFDFPGNWRPSTYIQGSPGRTDPSLPAGVVINEFAANTTYSDPLKPEYDSNDWIELYNNGEAVDLKDFFLSDDAGNLKKWRLPAGMLGKGTRVVFDEVTGFHNPVTSGFGLSSTGEELYLSFLPGTEQDRVVDSVRFKGQEAGITLGRYPDGGSYFVRLSPTRGSENQLAPPGLAISEVMYHPNAEGGATAEDPLLEFVELSNSGTTPLTLSNTTGGYRIAGGISFSFPTNGEAITLSSGQALVLVSFSPTDTIATTTFRAHYGAKGAVLAGPFAGRLGNSSDRVALERSQPGEAQGASSWVTLDEVIYTDESGADGDGQSLHRKSLLASGLDPANLVPETPTPGSLPSETENDADGDGLPDAWEELHGLNPADPTDATLDLDQDGESNRAEYIAGTDPRDRNDRLTLEVVTTGPGLALQFTAVPGRQYTIEYRDSLSGAGWQTLQEVTGNGMTSISDEGTSAQRYYRLRVSIAP